MNHRKSTAIISTLVGGAAIMVGAFYFLMGQINRVSDKADAANTSAAAATLSSSNVAGDVKALRQAVDDLKTQEQADAKNTQGNLDNLNSKLNLLLTRTARP